MNDKPTHSGLECDRAAEMSLQGCGPLHPQAVVESKSLRQQIFEQVRGAGRAARADVVRALGVSAGSVTTLTSDLIGQGLLREVADVPREPAAAAGRGRPPVGLEVVAECRHVIGLKLADQRHTAVLADFAGNIIAEAGAETRGSRKSVEALLDVMDELIGSLLGGTDRLRGDIAGVGIGMSGMVDHHSGMVSWSPLLGQRDVPLAAAFESRFGIPVCIDNDANMLTLAEMWFGSARSIADFLVVTIEGGVGMGAVMNSRLYRGTRGMGMEVGHTKVQLDGALCRCGRRGCLEAYVADYALAREAATALSLPTRHAFDIHTMLEDLFAEAKAGNEAAQDIFQRAGRYLAAGLANLCQIFDPALIILSGERMQYDFLYADTVLDEMRRLILHEGRAPQVEIHSWGDLVWARGAAALALERVTNEVVGGVVAG